MAAGVRATVGLTLYIEHLLQAPMYQDRDMPTSARGGWRPDRSGVGDSQGGCSGNSTLDTETK